MGEIRVKILSIALVWLGYGAMVTIPILWHNTDAAAVAFFGMFLAFIISAIIYNVKPHCCGCAATKKEGTVKSARS